MLFQEMILGWFKKKGEGPTPFNKPGIRVQTQYSRNLTAACTAKSAVQTRYARSNTQTTYSGE